MDHSDSMRQELPTVTREKGNKRCHYCLKENIQNQSITHFTIHNRHERSQNDTCEALSLNPSHGRETSGRSGGIEFDDQVEWEFIRTESRSEHHVGRVQGNYRKENFCPF